MGTFHSIQDSDAWKVARQLVRRVYEISGDGAFARDFGLRDQIREAAVSIVSNLGEGYERNGRKEFIQFLAWAKGSAGEVRSQLVVALDLGYISDASYEECDALAVRMGQMIAGWILYLRNTSVDGLKYKTSAISPSNDKR